VTRLLFDYDPIIYAAGSVGEKRTIKAVHRASGDEYEFDTRTQFWGHWKAKKGGWLAEYNKGRDSPRLPEEFDIIDIQTPEPLENCLHTVKSMIYGICETLNVTTYYGYSGKGKVFREDVSTVLQYKGNRVGALRPVHLNALKEYLEKYHDCIVVESIEADDAVSIDSTEAWKKWRKTGNDSDKLLLAYQDKDYCQCAGHLYNTNTKEPVCSYEGFGWLKEDEKGDVKGRGRLWLYHQVLSSDESDNYAANSACDMKWGQKKSFNLLKGCTNDVEAFSALVQGYKTLYPSPKKIIGWRGDEIEIDWFYMLQENFNLAKLLRTPDEKLTDVKKVMDKLGVEY
jgi:hypothetical protein